MSEREPAASGASKPFLARLAPDDREALEAAARRRRLPKGAVAFWEGDATDDVMILVSGRMKASVASSDGREVILSILDPGDILGELSALDGAPRSATVTTLESVDALVLPHSGFEALLRDRPGIAIEVLRIVTQKLRESSERELEFATVDALGRLCRCLLDLADRYGEPGPGGRNVQVPFAQHDLAAWTGLSREAIVKGLRTLRTLGWIETSGRRLTLLDETAVRVRAQLSAASPS
jgi:CRP-like cAMP-binding protein